jgi:hypothetical protein
MHFYIFVKFYLYKTLAQLRITFRLYATFFCARLEKMRSIFTGAKKCGGAKPHKGRKPGCGFS